MRTIRHLLVFIPLVFLLVAAVFPTPKGFVNDFAGVLDQDAKARLEDRLTAYERGTSNEIAIAIFQSLGGRTIEDLAVALFEEWKIGKRDKNNGIVIVAAIQDRKGRIEVGYGLEGKVPDAQAGRIIREAIAPRFREGRYADGLEAAVGELVSLIGGAPAAAPPSQPRSRARGLFNFFDLWYVVLFVMILVGYLRAAQRRCPRCGARMDLTATSTVAGGYRALHNVCPKCGYRERELRGISRGGLGGWGTGGFWGAGLGSGGFGSGGGGGFSGFGGGGSGGGGASGSW